MVRRKQGFTLVELVVVITVIAILATIGVVSFVKVQADSRDSARASRATVISEALEKYYDSHGEYPSCSQLTQAPSAISTNVLVGIDASVLKTPKSGSTENSISCTDLTDTSSGDYFSYTGDSSETCVGESGSACVLYTLKYIEESTGNIVSINSRRKTGLSSTDSPSLTLTASNFTQLSASWTAISGSTNYTIQYSKTTTFPADPLVTPPGPNTVDSGTLTSTSPTKSITSLQYGTLYYVRVRGENGAGAGSWSTTKSATTWSLSTPAGMTGAGNSSTQVTFSWTAVSHAASYNIRYSTSSSMTSPTTVTSTAASKALTGLSPGTTYYAQVQAVNGSYTSGWSSTASATAALSAPTITVSATSTTGLTVSWSALSGATGYILERSTSSAFTSITTTNPTGTSSSVTGLIPATTYYFRLRGTVGAYQGPNSAAKSATTLTPTVTLSAAKYCSDVYSNRSAYQLRVKVDEVSYNLTNNTSNVNWTIYRYTVTSGWNSWDVSKTWPYNVTVNGVSKSGSSNSDAFKNNSNAGATETIASGTVTVTHGADGTKTISFSGYDGTSSNQSDIFGNASCSGTYVLSDLR